MHRFSLASSRFVLPLCILGSLLVSLPAQNLVLNGSFENTTSTGCDLNLSNGTFSAMMSNHVGFGSADELDIMNGSCGYGSAPPDGIVKVGLACQYPNGSGVDAMALELASPLVPGQSYTLTFWVEAEVLSFSPDIGNVEIGVSTSSSSFGTQVFAGAAPSGGAWTQLTATFTAPLAATWLTVRQEANTDSWNHVDDFVLTSGFSLSASGACPGQMTFSVSGETPGGTVAFLYGLPGSFTHAGTPCTGTTVDLANPQVGLLGTNTSLTVMVPAGACGLYRVQAVDVQTCTVSNFVDL